MYTHESSVGEACDNFIGEVVGHSRVTGVGALFPS